MTSPQPLLERDAQGRWILRIDSSLLKESSCLQKVKLIAIDGLSPALQDTLAADYGTACHKALQVLYGGGNKYSSAPVYDQALYAAEDYFRTLTVLATAWRTLAHLNACLRGYFEHYEEDTLVADPGWLEHRFEHLWYEDDTVVVYLCGTVDFKGTLDGRKVILDHKTHTPYAMFGRTVEDAVADFLHSFQTSLQGKFYKLAVKRETGEDLPFAINGIFTQKNGKNLYRRSEVIEWSPETMQIFSQWLEGQVMTIIVNFKALLDDRPSFLPSAICDSQDKWPCQFKAICPARGLDELARETLLGDYVAKVRNPMKFQE